MLTLFIAVELRIMDTVMKGEHTFEMLISLHVLFCGHATRPSANNLGCNMNSYSFMLHSDMQDMSLVVKHRSALG